MNMKLNYRNSAGALLALGISLAGLAQPVEEKKEPRESRQITITTTEGEKAEKMVIVVEGDKVTINGKPAEDMKDGDVKVRVRKVKDANALLFETRPGARGGMSWFDGQNNFRMLSTDENRAMLGVTTEKTEQGAEVKDITPESAAEKAKLKEGDIIIKVDDATIGSPDDLSAAIKKHKPGDKVTITYLRDKKQEKVTAELGKWKGINGLAMGPGNNFRMDLGDLDFGDMLPRIQEMPFGQGPFNRGFGPAEGGGPKLGLTVQDTDDGKGVRVLDVEEESNAAKAEVKDNDIITHVDDKAVNSVDELSRELKARKGQATVRLQVTRSGKSKNIEVKMPRKLKTADL